jgi:hypothetical protein
MISFPYTNGEGERRGSVILTYPPTPTLAGDILHCFNSSGPTGTNRTSAILQPEVTEFPDVNVIDLVAGSVSIVKISEAVRALPKSFTSSPIRNRDWTGKGPAVGPLILYTGYVGYPRGDFTLITPDACASILLYEDVDKEFPAACFDKVA